MPAYHPPYRITSTILNQISEVSELIDHWIGPVGWVSSVRWKENRIRTIQASLAIEQNSLSKEQVTAIMEGKRVLAPAKEIQMLDKLIGALSEGLAISRG